MKKLIFLFVILLTISSCNSDDVIIPTAENPVDVYIAGSKNNKPCYWKNNQLVMLESSGLPFEYASKIIISNGNVYVFGSGHTGLQDINNNLFWKNGVLTNLTESYSTPDQAVIDVRDMDVVGDDVYFSGITKNPMLTVELFNFVYWKNGVKTTIVPNLDGIINSSISNIKAFNNDVYITTSINGSSGYYKNNTYYEMANASFIGSFVVNNNQIFTFYQAGSGEPSKILNITNNTSTIASFPNDGFITDLLFDSNNMYYMAQHNIYKNGVIDYGLNPSIPGEVIVDFKVLNNNLYTLENRGDNSGIGNIPLEFVYLNGVEILEADLLENFYSIYINQD